MGCVLTCRLASQRLTLVLRSFSLIDLDKLVALEARRKCGQLMSKQIKKIICKRKVSAQNQSKMVKINPV
jgi:hypothetical protein